MTESLKQFTKDGKFLMLAFDHRGSFKKLMNPEDPKSVSNEQAIELKRDVISTLDGQFSGLLVDIDTGLPAYESKTAPYLLPLEASGYVEDGGDRITKIEKKAAEIKELGAKGAKVLFYINPGADTLGKQLDTAKQVVEDCQSAGLPLFLEIRVYPENLTSAEMVEGALSSMQKFGITPDVWKLEYPGSLEACQKLTEMCGDTPWILLTAGVGFDQFVDQLKDAAKAGAQGFLAGRAVWQEAAKLEGEAKTEFLKETLPERFKTISDIVLG